MGRRMRVPVRNAFLERVEPSNPKAAVLAGLRKEQRAEFEQAGDDGLDERFGGGSTSVTRPFRSQSGRDDPLRQVEITSIQTHDTACANKPWGASSRNSREASGKDCAPRCTAEGEVNQPVHQPGCQSRSVVTRKVRPPAVATNEASQRARHGSAAVTRLRIGSVNHQSLLVPCTLTTAASPARVADHL